MTPKEELELVPNQQAKFKPLFKSERDYQEFCASFQKEVKPALDLRQEARRLSEEEAKRHLVY
ncbi:MAG: hypothetical protein ACREJC_05115 [Tepidisphaeraceae bacterium]